MSVINGISTTVSTDPSSQSAQSQDRLEEDLSRFLTLLTTQLQNQDPLDPMDSSEFTSQLVQFASVEQQIFQNANLETLINLQETNQVAGLIDFIDAEVEVEGQAFHYDGFRANMTYNIPNGAEDVTISITDAAGNQVFTADGERAPGVHPFQWDGRSNSGLELPPGAYQFEVNALSNTGELLPVFHTVFGIVTGAGVVDGVTRLFMNSINVEQSKVLSVNKPQNAGTLTAEQVAALIAAEEAALAAAEEAANAENTDGGDTASDGGSDSSDSSAGDTTADDGTDSSDTTADSGSGDSGSGDSGTDTSDSADASDSNTSDDQSDGT